VNEIEGSKCKGEDSKWMLSGFVPADGYAESMGATGLPGVGAKRICDKGPLGDCHYMFRSAAEEEIVRALVVDGIKRGIRAWGGEAQFKRAVCAPDILKGQDSTPLVRQALDQFCGVPRWEKR
jgi:hypothetical protein